MLDLVRVVKGRKWLSAQEDGEDGRRDRLGPFITESKTRESTPQR